MQSLFPLHNFKGMVYGAPHLSVGDENRVLWFRPLLQFQLIGNPWSYILEVDRGAGNALEANPVERETRQFADLHFPLHVVCLGRVAVATEQQEVIPLLIFTVIRFQDLLDFFHHFLRIHRTCCLHTPRETKRTRLVALACVIHRSTTSNSGCLNYYKRGKFQQKTKKLQTTAKADWLKACVQTYDLDSSELKRDFQCIFALKSPQIGQVLLIILVLNSTWTAISTNSWGLQGNPRCAEKFPAPSVVFQDVKFTDNLPSPW